MSKQINPAEQKREDGGTDYKMPTCQNPCYWTDNEGAHVGQCPLLEVTVYGLFCEDDDC